MGSLSSGPFPILRWGAYGEQGDFGDLIRSPPPCIPVSDRCTAVQGVFSQALRLIGLTGGRPVRADTPTIPCSAREGRLVAFVVTPGQRGDAPVAADLSRTPPGIG